MDSDPCINKIILALQELFDNAKVDKGHGVDHSRKVLEHSNNALVLSKKPKEKYQRQAIRYACLLHDADDRKFFPQSKKYQNARKILKDVIGENKVIIELTIKLISLVSCSQNGNSFDEGTEKWMLIPRLCDRLEAIGEIGILRTWIYTKHVFRPLFTPSTLRVTNEDELKKVITPERFSRYLQEKKSESMIDHFYDKLFHICSDEVISGIENPYLRSEMKKRREIISDFIFRFGIEGEIDIQDINRIRAKIYK